MKTVRYSFIPLLIVAFSLLVVSIASSEFLVKSIYFMPTDSIDRSVEINLDGIMKSVQDTYRDEMNRHGFGSKTFELETDKKGKVVVHKMKGKQDISFYSRAGSFTDIHKEVQEKGFNSKQSIYVVVMAGMKSVSGGSAGVSTTSPNGAWFGNNHYYGFCISIESERWDMERVIRHELGHTFGLSHIVLYNQNGFIMGVVGDKLAFHEARWMSRIQYFNHKWNHNVGPEITRFHGAFNQADGKIKITGNVFDADGLFQAYGFVDTPTTVTVATVGINFYEGGVHARIEFDDIERRLLTKSNKIWLQLMDVHGNWRYHNPSIYELPDKINKNEDLNIVEDDPVVVTDCPGCKPTEDNVARSVSPSRQHITTTWGQIKK